MKTYLRRPYDKSLTAVFYSSSDTFKHLSSPISARQRVIQASTKEQQVILSSSRSPRIQHVHSGKYGIRPLWPSDKSSCEQWIDGKKSTKYRSSSIASRHHRDRCVNYKSDSQKNPLLQFASYVNQEHRLILLLASTSLLLLLLIYIFYRRRQHHGKVNENKLSGQQRRQTFEDNLFIHRPIEHRLSTVPLLPTITEETSAVLSPSNSSSKLPALSNSINTPLSASVIDDNDRRNSSSKIVSSEKILTNTQNGTKNVVHISLLPKETQSVSIDTRRRSRFDKDQSPSATEPPVVPIDTRRRSRFDKDQSPSVTDTSAVVPLITRRRSRFDKDQSPSLETDLPLPVVVRKPSVTHQNAIKDDFTSLEEVNNAVKEVGLDRSQLIFGIDYTISNLETGKTSFHGLSLHTVQDGLLNPYQSVITIIGRTLEKYDSDSAIPAFGFGDRATTDRKIFPLRLDGSSCKGFQGVLDAYNEITPKVRMSGPTNFAPLIREAIKIVKKTEQYHILVIVADGQVTNERQTKDAIVEASNYPLSIVMVGVGDGPWDMMEEFDDSLPTRQFDNFQFVNFNSVVEASTNTDSSFALQALMEIPSQYASIKELGLLKN